MRLYTGTGDRGETSLYDGSRASKDSHRIEAYGTVDELNAALGACAASCTEGDWARRIRHVQGELFVIGSDLATPDTSRRREAVPHVPEEASRRLEVWIDQAVSSCPPLRNFVLPGGCELAVRLHQARTICRRAERAVVGLVKQETVNPEILVYLNRLGDLLFAWAREANARAGVAEVEWDPKRPAGEFEG